MSQSVSPGSIHNAQLLDRLRAVSAAAEDLARRGFVLAGIEIQAPPRKPVVWVEYTRACNALRGGAIVRNAQTTIMAAPLDDVQVQWEVRRMAS